MPGTVGGAIFGNAGAFGGEIKDSCLEVQTLDIETLTLKTRKNQECRFGYRNSVFKNDLAQKEVIVSAVFQFVPGDRKEIEKSVLEKINYRTTRQPLEYPSAGSTFKNVSLEYVSQEIKLRFADKVKNDPFPIIPAAVFIADAGLIGLRIGGAQVSEKHPNFIVNLGDASASDVLSLIDEVVKTVQAKFGIVLEPEIIKPDYD